MFKGAELMADFSDVFAGKNVLITGGMGFIGSNLAIALVRLGANVLILDSMIPDYGGNTFNIAPVENDVRVHDGDIRDKQLMNELVQGQDFIFHLAGQVDHVLSLTNPYPDIDINITGTAVLLEACKHHNPAARVIYTGTRGQYGPAVSLPVAEDAPTHPKGIYEISNLTAEKMIQVYHEIHHIRGVLLRLTNIYGPRAQMKHSRYGVVNWFVRLAMDNQPIKVFGDGLIKRDFVYVGDCIDAILRLAVEERAYGEIFNVGMDQPTNFIELADTIVRVTGADGWEFAPFSPERKAQEPGDFFSDITKIRGLVGWSARTSLEDGIRQTVDYYRRHKAHYW